VREYVALVRECLSGETVSFDGDFYRVSRFRLGLRPTERKPKIIIGALNAGMLKLAGEVADGVLLNYLPASLVPWSVEQIRAGGPARVYAYVHVGVTDRDRYAESARRDLFSYAVVDAYAANFARAGYGDAVAQVRSHHEARERDAAIAAVSDAWVDGVQIMGDAKHVADSVQAYVDAGVETPIVFPLPWGEDRSKVVEQTLIAARP
jgi:alkanesulfonate monooxygenase SsuD/methylene tetrahydromethanopterin reductase-like flavin-dependent oxidoreductase (luciferase family)